MTLPTPLPPSDSLYKFTAIGGLIMLVLSVYAPWKIYTDLKSDTLNLQYEKKVLDRELKNILVEMNNMPNPSEAEMVRMQKRSGEIVMLELKMTHSNDKLQLLKSQADVLRTLALVANVISFVLIVFGFINWYIKFQMYQDQIIKAQAEQWTTHRTMESEKEEVPG